MRVHVCAVRMTLHRADVLEAYLNGQDNIQKATVYERTGDVVLTYRGSRKDADAKAINESRAAEAAQEVIEDTAEEEQPAEQTAQ